MRSRTSWSISALVASCLLLALHGRAKACSCLASPEEDYFENSDYVVRLRAVASFPGVRDKRWYLAVVTAQAYKGCLRERSFAWIQTENDEAACGVTLDADTEYLVHAAAVGRSLLGLPILETGLCNGNRPIREVDAATQQFLSTREVCCGGSCECAGDTERVQCLVDPCQVSACSEPGAVCRANYCGGCNAEWYDPDGWRVCLAETDS
ncbi:MAG: hypothetical protein ABW321_22210 [Polyangiales bacterium]